MTSRRPTSYWPRCCWPKSDELSKATRRFLERLKAHLVEVENTSFYAGYIRQTFRLTPTTTKRHLRTLVAYGYAKIVGGGPRTGYEYELVDEDKRLSEAVENALDQVLEKLKTEWASGQRVG